MKIKLRDVLDLFDDWNGTIRVNDDSLNTIMEIPTKEFGFKDGKFHDELILESEIVSFGFYDEVFAVRIKYQKGEKA